jgi:hypothetical protein
MKMAAQKMTNVAAAASRSKAFNDISCVSRCLPWRGDGHGIDRDS